MQLTHITRYDRLAMNLRLIEREYRRHKELQTSIIRKKLKFLTKLFTFISPELNIAAFSDSKQYDETGHIFCINHTVDLLIPYNSKKLGSVILVGYHYPYRKAEGLVQSINITDSINEDHKLIKIIHDFA